MELAANNVRQQNALLQGQLTKVKEQLKVAVEKL